MAIIEMKKMSLLAMQDDKEELLRLMQKAGCVQIEPLDEEEWQPFVKSAGDGMAVEEQSRVRWAISELSRYGGSKQGFIASLRGKPAVEAEKYRDVLSREAVLMGVVAEAEQIERQSGELRSTQARIETLQEQLLPWQPLRIDLAQIGQSKHTHSELYTITLRELMELREDMDARQLPVAMEVVTETPSMAYILLVCHVDVARETAELLRAHNAAGVVFPSMQGTVTRQMDEQTALLRKVDEQRDALREQMKELGVYVDDLKILYDALQARAEREKAAARFAITERTFFVSAWVPAPQAQALESALLACASCAVEFREPLEDEKPPTLLHNGRITSNFEGIVKNFSSPDPRGLDPTFMMTPFFACFFGMMLSDAGYGMILALLLPVLAFVIKPKRGEKKMLYVLGIGGLFTIFWGAMFNTWFGAGIRPMLLDPLNQPLEMMGLCLGVGAVHLFTGLGIGAYMNIKRGKPLDALYDQGFWAMLVLGLGLLVLPQTAAVGQWMAIIGAGGIILFAGRGKSNIFSRIVGGLGSLYNITGWISDLLSYARLFGMGLATGVIGMVINMLATMIMKNPVGIVLGCLILVGGHAFNMGINTLGAYVHSCRLQYIEFFGKFYEDGGSPFTPLTEETRYVDLSEVE